MGPTHANFPEVVVFDESVAHVFGAKAHGSFAVGFVGPAEPPVFHRQRHVVYVTQVEAVVLNNNNNSN